MKREDLLLEQWKTASDLNKHEDDITWQKFNYFITLNGILLSAFGVIWSQSIESGANVKTIAVLLSAFGVIVSLIWTLMEKRGQIYHWYRVTQARQAEEALKIDGERVLDLYDKGLNTQELVPVPNLLKKGIFRIHSLILTLGIITFIGWFVLLIYWLFFN